MGKISLLARTLVRKDFVLRFWSTFVAVFVLPSALLTILGAHWSLESTSLLIIFALLFSAFVHRRKLAKIHLPPSPEILIGERTFLHCPSSSSLAIEATRLAQDSYSTERSISPDQFQQLRIKNPLILACLTGANGDLLGYFDVIPLKVSFAELFLRGAVTEMQITHEDIFAADEAAEICNHLFISGLAVRYPETQIGRLSASVLIWAIIKYIDHFYGRRQPLVFALASSHAGNDLLRKFKFEVACEAADRRDRYRLYQLRLSREAIAQRLECVPDWSFQCTLEWSPRRRGGTPHRPRRVALPKRKAYTLPEPLSTRSA